MAEVRPGRVLAIGAALAVALAAGWWFRGGSPVLPAAVGVAAESRPQDAAASRATLPLVEVGAVRTTTIRDSALAVGSLRSRQSVMLRPEAAGRVVKLDFTDGQQVGKGQLLVQLDDRLALAQVQQNRAELSIAQTNHQRNIELAGKGFISPRAVDESAAAAAVARAKLELAQAGAARLRVLAPFAGTAGIRRVNVGDMLQSGADIAPLEDLEAMLLDFRLPERHQSRLHVGQVNTVTLDALPGHAFEAVVQAIDPVIDVEGRTVGVRACIDNHAGLLRPGMFARVDAALGQRTDARMVPEEALVPLGGKFYVYALGPDDDRGVEAVRTEVELGVRRAGAVEVVTGLGADARIIVAGQQRLSTPVVRVRLAAPADAVPDGEPLVLASGVAEGSDAATASELIVHQAPSGDSPCLVAGRH